MAEKSTFIKLDRNIQNWRWYQCPNTFRVFVHILLNANVETHDFMNTTIHRGEMATSYAKLGDALNLTGQQVRTAISHLKSTEEITVKQHSKFLIISVLNYAKYQDKLTVNQQADNRQITPNQHSLNSQLTVNQQAVNSQLTTIKECKEVKEVKECKEGKEVRQATATTTTTTTEASLVDLYGYSVVEDYKKRFTDFCNRTGANHLDCITTITKWIREDGVKPKPKGTMSSFNLSDIEERILAEYGV